MERGGREAAGRFLDFVPVLAPASERYLFYIPDAAKGGTVDQITNWVQSNWYELGSLVAQFTFVFAGLWFAGKILKTMRATQQQMGALLRLSMTGGVEEHPQMNETARETVHGAAHEPAPSVVASSMFGADPERATSYATFEKPARIATPSLSSELSGQVRASASLASVTIAPTQDPTPYVEAP